MNNQDDYKSDILDQLDESGNPIRRARLPKRMQLAYKIANALDAMDWNNKELTKKLGKKYQSQITKWLKGDHNFTVNTLSDIEEILGIKLLAVSDTADEELNAMASHMTVSVDISLPQMQNTLFPSEEDKHKLNAFLAFSGGTKASQVEVKKMVQNA